MYDEKGYKAQCINVGSTVNLTKYEEYYVYPNGPSTFYVSRFPYPKKSLLGVYNKLFFNVLEDIPEKEEAAVKKEPVHEFVEEQEQQMSLF